MFGQKLLFSINCGFPSNWNPRNKIRICCDGGPGREEFEPCQISVSELKLFLHLRILHSCLFIGVSRDYRTKISGIWELLGIGVPVYALLETYRVEPLSLISWIGTPKSRSVKWPLFDSAFLSYIRLDVRIHIN